MSLPASGLPDLPKEAAGTEIATLDPMAEAAQVIPHAESTECEPVEGRILGGTYRVLARLDEGSMAAVFEAEHLRLRRRVAIKVLNGELASRPDVLSRFQQEAEIVSRIDHPHVVKVIDFAGTEHGELYLVLERLYGETLEKRLEREGRLEVDQAIEIALQIASALSAVHDMAVVHRDLKPSNVFLTKGPNDSVCVKLFDFGISKIMKSTRRITAARTLVGTPEYMAPEQATGLNVLVDARTDQYALAIVVYEMLTGEQPFFDDNLSHVLKRVMTHMPRPASSLVPSIPVALDGVLARGLAKDPAARFESVADFAKELAAATHVTAPTSSSPPASAVRERTTPSAYEPPVPSAPESAHMKSRRTSPAFGMGSIGRPGPITQIGPPHAPRSKEVASTAIEGPGSIAPSRRVAASIERARAAFDDGAVAEATTYATAAFAEALDSEDPAVAALLRVSEPLLARVFMCRIGSSARRLFANRAAKLRELPLSPRAAFLLSRIDDGITVADLLDVTPFSRLEALRYLVQLVSAGAVKLAPAPDE